MFTLFALTFAIINDNKKYNCNVGVYRLVGGNPVFRYKTKGKVREEAGLGKGTLQLMRGNKKVGSFDWDNFIPGELGGYYIDIIEKESGTFDVLKVTVEKDQLAKNAIPYPIKDTMADTIKDIDIMFAPKTNWWKENTAGILSFLMIVSAVSLIVLVSGDLKEMSNNNKAGMVLISAAMDGVKINQTQIDYIYSSLKNETIQYSTPAATGSGEEVVPNG